jgi:Concanavalin A-like lectin/glucanases superfamily
MRGFGAGLVAGVGLALVWAAPASAMVVAQWQMDEPAGATTMVDSSGSGNNGTLFGVTAGLPGSTGAGGDHAYGFDGSTSHVNVPRTSSLVIGSNDATITMHVNTTAKPGTGAFDFDLIRDGGATVEIVPTSKGNRARCHFAGSSAALTLVGGPSLTDGQWHTIVCQKTSSGISLTVDTTTLSKSGTVGTVKAGPKVVAIGWKTDNTDFYNGLMDDVSIDISPPA